MNLKINMDMSLQKTVPKKPKEKDYDALISEFD
jgi:hypothetical protein